MQRNRAFTLIELMAVIAIIGILASLAISAYQTYTVRAQVTEAISFTESTTARVAEMYSKTGSPPVDRIDAGLPADPTDNHGNYVSQVAVINGRVEITFGNEAHPDIASDTLSLTPYVTPGTLVVWRCGKAPKPAGQLMANSDATIGAEYKPGSIDSRYLPSSCR